MSGQSGLRQRAALLDELRQIVQAMKNIAFAELQRVGRIRQAQAQACGVVMRALRSLPDDAAAGEPTNPGPVGWLVIGAERGFCGAFNARLVAAMTELREQDAQARLFVASHRVMDLLGSAAAGAVALPGCAATEEADVVLDDWVGAIADPAQTCRELWLLHTDEAGLVRRRLLPVPEAAAPPAPSGMAPAHHLPVPELRGALRRQALRLLLQAGLYASLEQENHWRLTQMQRAQDHLDELSKALQRRYAALRQADITNELETLVSSLDGRG